MFVKYSVAFLVACPLIWCGPLSFPSPLGANEMRDGEPNRPTPAARLFEEAIAADAAGDAALYVQLLRRAVQADPDFQLAHWHLGHVLFQGQWCSPETVGRIVSHDSRWVEYRQRLQTASDTTATHVALALWCRQAELENEEKWHWHQVLQVVPNHRKALASLGVKRYQGGLYTPAEIKGIEQRHDREQFDFKLYQRKFKRLWHQARRDNSDERSERLAELSIIRDPAAVPALFDLLVQVNREHDLATDTEANPFDEQVGSAVVTALSNIQQHDATLRLLDIAVFAASRSVRHSAALALRYREPTSYVPLLMANLATPIESTHDVLVLPSGQISLIEEVYQEGPESGAHEVRTSHFATQSFLPAARNTSGAIVRGARQTGSVIRGSAHSPILSSRLVSDWAGDYRRAAARVANTQRRVAQENLVSSRRNAKIKEVLETATGQLLGDDPKIWWTAWQQYNELYVPETLPVYESESYDDYRIVVRTSSCFIAGTPVWTQAGPVAIEQIQTGDLVLSQDPFSGRLAYRPVIDTTDRPPSAVIELTFNNETITTTLGHRFWVTGKGWRMAKFLVPGDRLFSPGRSIGLLSTTATPKSLAFNLVVADYHTYFVGQSRLLVHDNNCPQPTVAALPGVAANN